MGKNHEMSNFELFLDCFKWYNLTKKKPVTIFCLIAQKGSTLGKMLCPKGQIDLFRG